MWRGCREEQRSCSPLYVFHRSFQTELLFVGGQHIRVAVKLKKNKTHKEMPAQMWGLQESGFLTCKRWWTADSTLKHSSVAAAASPSGLVAVLLQRQMRTSWFWEDQRASSKIAASSSDTSLGDPSGSNFHLAFYHSTLARCCFTYGAACTYSLTRSHIF